MNKKRIMQIVVDGYEVLEKDVKPSGSSSRIYLPKHWEGKKAKAILVEE